MITTIVVLINGAWTKVVSKATKYIKHLTIYRSKTKFYHTLSMQDLRYHDIGGFAILSLGIAPEPNSVYLSDGAEYLREARWYDFGKFQEGCICFQDHPSKASFKNIMIKGLD